MRILLMCAYSLDVPSFSGLGLYLGRLSTVLNVKPATPVGT